MGEEYADMEGTIRQALEDERARGVRLINTVRFGAVTAYVGLEASMRWLVGLHNWGTTLHLYAAYWLAATVLLVASRRSRSCARAARFAIPIVDMPFVFVLQRASFPTSTDLTGLVGFTAAILVFLVIASMLTLETWQLTLSAAMAALLEVVLQRAVDRGRHHDLLRSAHRSAGPCGARGALRAGDAAGADRTQYDQARSR